MTKLSQVWVVAGAKAAALELIGGARQLGEQVTLLTWNADAAVAADRAYVCSGSSVAEYIEALAQLAQEQQPPLVIVETSRNGRLIASRLAAVYQTSALTDLTELWLEDDKIYGKRMVYGGAAFRTTVTAAPAVACVGAGVFEAAADAPCAAVEQLAARPLPGIRFIERQERPVQQVNLAAAKKVVSAGRGLGSEENMALIRDLAAAWGAEIGCSRPVAEEEHWLPRERYVGVSGVMLKPEAYLAVGISGQVQHMVGANQSGTILAINKDKLAPIFTNCDLGLVADLNKVLPLLTEKLAAK